MQRHAANDLPADDLSATGAELGLLREVLRLLPAGAPIYSNGYDAIHYLTGQPALYLPEKVIHGTGRANQNYQFELDRMQRDLREHKGVVVYFNTLPERWFLPSESELKTLLPLTEIAKGSDGSIWKVLPEIK